MSRTLMYLVSCCEPDNGVARPQFNQLLKEARVKKHDGNMAESLQMFLVLLTSCPELQVGLAQASFLFFFSFLCVFIYKFMLGFVMCIRQSIAIARVAAISLLF